MTLNIIDHHRKSVLLSETFPLDLEKRNFIRQVKNAVFSVVHPTPFNTSVQLAAVSYDVLTGKKSLSLMLAKYIYIYIFTSNIFLFLSEMNVS